jgi:hypothetical protein
MKKQLLTVMLANLLLFGQLMAQDKDSVVTMPTLTVTSAAMVTQEVDKAFKKSFPGAANLEWYKVNKDYLAKFIKDDMQHRSLFAKNGYLKYDISYGYEKNLPENIRTMVNNAYEDHNITNVANVKEEGRNIWVINLVSLKHLILVRVEDDEMEEVAKYDKGR